jgi:glucans biosynthesis protein
MELSYTPFGMHHSIYKILAGLILSLQAFAANAADRFGFQTVVERARLLAEQPYQAPLPAPRFLLDLNYDQYRDIRFDPDKSLWRRQASPFKALLNIPGTFYRHPVKINVIDIGGVHPVPFDKNNFIFEDQDLKRRVPLDLGYAGFVLTYPINDPKIQDQFIVFAGASYFRAVGRGNVWGLTARGLAIDTGLPSGEEFPDFVEYWLEQPAAGAREMRVYALLDGPSVTGAFDMVIRPGLPTEIKVSAVIFPRTQIRLLGIAPLTSMFYYGENSHRPQGEWRGEVHDSDGLLFQNGSGEWLWRPLQNPGGLEVDYFNTGDIKGFGLLQRDAQFSDYQDLSARYDLRPSAWVRPDAKWGVGQIVLLQIPTTGEWNDNIVAFWTPEQPLPPNQPYKYGYTLGFGGPEPVKQPVGRAINSFIGDGNVTGGGSAPGAYRILVDFTGGDLDKLAPDAMIEPIVSGINQTEVLESFVEYNQALASWRLSILARPAEDKALDLRAYLLAGGRALTETWSYRLPPGNGILNLEE